jgi:G3E family GTPase
MDLHSGQAFHPERLLHHLGRLGAGRHRSRGCFWLPTRPGRMLEWAGAGGQVSVGAGQGWHDRTRLTRLVLTGVGTPPAHLADAFSELLAAPADALPGEWQRDEDGLEPWLGPIG